MVIWGTYSENDGYIRLYPIPLYTASAALCDSILNDACWELHHFSLYDVIPEERPRQTAVVPQRRSQVSALI